MQSSHGKYLRFAFCQWLTWFSRLQEETARVEDSLLDNQTFTAAIAAAFTHSKSSSFENLLEPLQKLLRLSQPIAASMARSAELFECIGQKLNSNKPAIRLNLLRIIGSICDATDDGGLLLDHFGLFDMIRELQVSDSAVLVRSMAQELIRSCEEVDNISIHSGSGGGGGGKRRLNGAVVLRRTSASTTPPHLLERQMSMPIGPGSPQLGRPDRSSMGLFDGSDGVVVGLSGRLAQTPRRQRNGIGYINGSAAIRPVSRDGGSGVGRESSPGIILPHIPALQRASTTVGSINTSSVSGSNANEIGVAKSRLPRGTTGGHQRIPRQSTTQVNGSRDSGGTTASTVGTPSGVNRTSRESLYGARNGSAVDITVASAKRSTARRRPSGDAKWS
jgi:hypothetical protein